MQVSKNTFGVRALMAEYDNTNLWESVDELVRKCFSTGLFDESRLGFQRRVFPLSADKAVRNV